MSRDLGKDFERHFKEDFEKIEGVSAIRIYDTQGKNKGVTNICDFICYKYPQIFLLECKSHAGNTFPIQSKNKETGRFKPFRQYSKLLKYKNKKGMKVGLILWFYERDKIIFVDISELEKMILDEKRSINVKDIDEKLYNIIEIPSIKKQTFMKSDYSILLEE